jgi:hypothetical protein
LIPTVSEARLIMSSSRMADDMGVDWFDRIETARGF